MQKVEELYKCCMLVQQEEELFPSVTDEHSPVFCCLEHNGYNVRFAQYESNI